MDVHNYAANGLCGVDCQIQIFLQNDQRLIKEKKNQKKSEDKNQVMEFFDSPCPSSFARA